MENLVNNVVSPIVNSASFGIGYGKNNKIKNNIEFHDTNQKTIEKTFNAKRDRNKNNYFSSDKGYENAKEYFYNMNLLNTRV